MSETQSFEAVPEGDDLVYLAAIQQLVLERSHDLITVTDALGTIVYASPSWEGVLGWSPEALTGEPIAELVHPDDRGAAEAGFVAVLRGSDVAGVTARFKTHDGRWVPIETSGSPGTWRTTWKVVGAGPSPTVASISRHRRSWN